MVSTEELIPLYHEVLIWLLKKDLVVRLHLRVRVVVTPELKARVREERARKVREKEKRKEDSRETETKEVKETIQGEGPKEESTNAPAPQSSPVNYWLTMSPKSARRHTRKLSLSRRTSSEKPLTEDHSLLDYPEESQYGYENDEEEEEEEDEASIFSDDSGSPEWDRSSIICDPARATRLERAWLAAMSEGKELYITKRFEQCVSPLVGIFPYLLFYSFIQVFCNRDAEIVLGIGSTSTSMGSALTTKYCTRRILQGNS